MSPVYLSNYASFARKAASFAAGFNPCVILDSCGIQPQLNKGRYKLLLAFGGNNILEPGEQRLNSLYTAWQAKPAWMFGVLGFDLKNEIEKLRSDNHCCFGWPELSFFLPETVITVTTDDLLTIYGPDPISVYEQILDHKPAVGFRNSIRSESDLLSDFSEAGHETAVNRIKEEIRNGNVYELNLCSRFLYSGISVEHPYLLYEELKQLSPTPFSGYFVSGEKQVLSASPERYLGLYEHTLLSQPIKGTRPRGKDEAEDHTMRNDLQTNIKDRAENVMIVDLVRNDLARVSVPGSVQVEELFGIYTYSHVHQMVSTISSRIERGRNWMDAIRASFPMGSMTGTPKIAALQWIEELETSAREWYSGAMGYIDPEGNMDFNVLIRSIFCDPKQKLLAYYAGGAITIDSDPQEEYREMMVKGEAIHKLLQKYLR